MMVKHNRISHWISQLSDWEILSAYSYCSKLLKRENLLFEEEIKDVCFFFFDGDKEKTVNSLEEIRQMYYKEYSKRHSN